MDDFKKKDPQKKYTKKLKKQTDRLHENSGIEKQLHLKITNQKQPDDKIQTTVKFVREEKSPDYDTQGLLHKLANQRFRVVGDVPKLSDMKPESAFGKAALQTAKAGNFVIKKTGSALLTAESAGLKFNDYLRQKDIEKQQKILSKEQLQIRFTRRPNDKGKYKTYINFTRGENNFKLQNRGIVHRLVNQKYRFVGDVPPVSKRIDTSLNKWMPKTAKGKAAKGIIQGGKTVLKTTSNTALKTALAADSGIVKLTDYSKYYAKRAVNEGVLKYKRESDDDANKAVLEASQLVFDTGMGIKHHFKKKKQHQLHKARYRLQKYSARDLKLQMKPVLKQNKRDLKAKNALLKINKISYKQNLDKLGRYRLAGKDPDALYKVQNLKKTQFRVQKKLYKQEKKLLKKQRKKVTSELKFSSRKLRNLRLSNLLSTPMPLVLRPMKYSGKRIAASSYQKAINADQNNDFMKVADTIKRQGLDRAARELSPSKLLEKNQQKNNKAQKKHNKQKSKLQKSEKKLKSKAELKKSSTTKKTASKLADKAKKAVKKSVNNVYKKEVVYFFAAHAIPLILVLLLFVMLFSCTSATISQSGFILGTFAAQDIDLSQAEEFYTKLGFDMNKKIINIAPDGVISKSYKTYLKNLGINTKFMTDDPTSVYWGRSDKLNYDPVWDFDPWKLWSFLCAYNYEFVTNQDNTQDVKYWEFNDKIKNQIKQLFVDEYQFECVYDNASHWEELYNYDFKGFHYTVGGGFQGYGRVEFQTMPDSLSQFALGNNIYFSIDNGEILNYNKNYASTGWYFQDQRYMVTDPSGRSFEPFYQYDTNAFQTEYSGGYGRYHQFVYRITGETQNRETWIWIPRHPYTVQLPDGRDFQNTFNVIAAPNDVAVEQYKGANTLYIAELAFFNPDLNLMTDDWSYVSNTVNDEVKVWGMGEFISKCYETGKPEGMTNNKGLCSFYQKYEWKKECSLYYNVKQKKTFEQVILDKLSTLSDKEERIAYYNILIGSEDGMSLYGNHQTLANPFTGGTFKDYMEVGNILNHYGYDMQGWDLQHCNIAVNGTYHKGVDVYYPANMPICAPFDCKIDKYDAENHVVVLRKNSVDYWYDDKRDTAIYLTNITLNSGYSKGSTLKSGENFAVSSANGKCMYGEATKTDKTINSDLPYEYVHIAAYIDTDGYGWNFVDPILLFT